MQDVQVKVSDRVKIKTSDRGTFEGLFVGFIKFGNVDSVVIQQTDALDADYQYIIPMPAITGFIFRTPKTLENVPHIVRA